jgi:hypothetical protein
VLDQIEIGREMVPEFGCIEKETQGWPRGILAGNIQGSVLKANWVIAGE